VAAQRHSSAAAVTLRELPNDAQFSVVDWGYKTSDTLIAKGKPVERRGRKASGLRDASPTTAGLPDAASLVVRFARCEHVHALEGSRRAADGGLARHRERGHDMQKCAARQSVGHSVILMAFLAVALAGCDGDEDRTSSAAPLPSPSSGSASLEWLAPTTATDGSTLSHLVGYRIYYGNDVNQLNETIEVSNPGVLTYVVEGLPPGTYYFAVTAFNATGESTRSNAGRKIIS
jgi:hypothetical protein